MNALVAVPLTPAQAFDLRLVRTFVADIAWEHYPQHVGAADDLDDLLSAAVVTQQSIAILRNVREYLERLPRAAYRERKFIVAVLDDLLRQVAA